MTDATLPPVDAGTPTAVDRTVVTCPRWWTAPRHTLHSALQALGHILPHVVVHVRRPTEETLCQKAWVGLGVPLAAVRAAAGLVGGAWCAQPMFTVLLVRERQGVVRLRLTKSAVGGGDVRLRRALQAVGHALASGQDARLAFARAIQGTVCVDPAIARPLLEPCPSLQGDCFLSFLLKQVGKVGGPGPGLWDLADDDDPDGGPWVATPGPGFRVLSTVQTVLSALLGEAVARVLTCRKPAVGVAIVSGLRDVVVTTRVSPTVLVFAALALHTLHTVSLGAPPSALRTAIASCSQAVLLAVDLELEQGEFAKPTNTAALEIQTARALLRQVVPFHAPLAALA